MMQIYYGRQCIDKDRYIFENIKGDTLLIVPDQFTLQAERDAFFYCKEKKGFMDLEVLSFSRLGARILKEVGGSKRPMIDKQGRHMLLAKILKKQEGFMELYRKYSGNTAFIERVNNFISEIKQQGITPQLLLAKGEETEADTFLQKKLKEIHGVFSAYEEAIGGKYVDTEDLVTLYSEKIPESKWLVGKTVWVYGFDYFTPKNLQVLGSLLGKVREMKVILTWDDSGRDAHVFSLGGRMVRKLQKTAEGAGKSCKIKSLPDAYRCRRPTALATLEGELFALPAGKGEESRGITLVRAANYYAEGETAAAKVLELVREKGYRFREISLICNDMEIRGDIYKRVFAQHGIDLFLDKKRDILHSPAVAFIIALMDVISGGYAKEDVLRLLKTGLSDLEVEEIEALENYADTYYIRGPRWKTPFTKGVTEYGEEGLARLEASRAKVMDDLLLFAEDFKGGKTVKEKVETTYKYLKEKAKIPEKLEELMERQLKEGDEEAAEETAQIWNIAVKIMDQLVAVIGEENISMKDYNTLFRAGFEAVEIGLLPPTVDGLVMGTMQRSRSSRIRATLILGANEGVLPAAVSGDGLFSEEEKERLNEGRVVCKSDSLRMEEENLAIYKNIAKTGEELWVSCSASDEEGRAEEPSLIFEKIREIFDIEPEKDLANREDPMGFLGGKYSTLSHLAGALRRWDRGEAISDAMMEALLWYRKNAPEQYGRLMAGLEYTNRAENIGQDLASGLYRKEGVPDFSFSSSRLEKYGKCPFSHFVGYGLRPLERRSYEIAPLDVGDLCHRCLMKLSERLTKEGVEIREESSPWMTVSKEECDRLVEEILLKEGRTYREGLISSGREQEYRGERVKQICRESAWIMVDHVRKGAILAMGYEVPFGRSYPMKPIQVPYGDGTIFIEGKIDRIDQLEDGYVKVIDYKSGNATYSEEEAKAGWKLQLFVYLLAASGEEKKPAGAFYFPISEPFIDASGKEKNVVRQSLEKDLRKEFKMDGILLNKDKVIRGVAGEFSRFSDIAPVERVQGSPKPTAKVLDEEEFHALLSAVSLRIEEMSREIVTGEIGIHPRKTKTIAACTHCDYKGICKFDRAIEGCDYVRI